MKNGKTILFVCFFSCQIIAGYSQRIFKDVTVMGWVGLGAQDRRLFDLRLGPSLLELDYNHVDYQYGVTVQSSIIRYRFLQATLGISYLQSNTNFPRPYRYKLLDGAPPGLPFKVIKIYKVNQIAFPFSTFFYLNSRKGIFINVICRPAFILSKTANDRVFDVKQTKWHPEFRGLDILPGAGVKFGKHWSLALHYRWHSIYKIDPVIFYHALFFESDPEFLKKKYDTYNPFQMQMTVGYVIRK